MIAWLQRLWRRARPAVIIELDVFTPDGRRAVTLTEKKDRMSETEFTERGFAFQSFRDFNGVECNVQKSSLATDDCIWLGAREIGLKKFVPYAGWSDVDTKSDPLGISYVANNRMHLSRDQVADLLPVLQHFVDTGELPSPTHPTIHRG